MNEQDNLSYKLTVESKDSNGVLKELRFISHTPKSTVEFVPNKLYISLLNQNKIKPDTFKIPILLGKRKRVYHGNN